MSDLAAELERIARLRGKAPDAYTPETNAQAGAVTLDAGRLMSHCGDPWLDMVAFDSLPKASREFVAHSPLGLCAVTYASFLRAVRGNEAALLANLEQIMPKMLRNLVADKYRAWPTHPQAEERPHA